MAEGSGRVSARLHTTCSVALPVPSICAYATCLQVVHMQIDLLGVSAMPAVQMLLMFAGTVHIFLCDI